MTSSTAGERVRAFVPKPLPPDPPLSLGPAEWALAEVANRSLGRLDGISRLLPDPSLFLYFYVRKEALLSSQIEGTQSSFSDLLLFESEQTPGVPLADVQEVSRYVAAMNHGLSRLRGGFPLSSRLLREIHEKLLSGSRGGDKQPGEFRRTQNWLGGTRPGNARFVPPPHDRVQVCMSDLEKFLHDERGPTPALLKAALAHVQFETIHPFLDGNGRLGRLLITFLLCAGGAIREPLLYLSLHLKEHRDEYYARLQAVRLDGDWEGWIRFFLTGVRETADVAVATAERIVLLFSKHREAISSLGRFAGSVLRVHVVMQRRPLLTISTAAKESGMTQPTVTKALLALEKLQLVREVTGRARDRVFAYAPYLALLGEGTQPLAP